MNRPEHFDYLNHDTPNHDLLEVRNLARRAPFCAPGQKIIVEVGSWAGLSAWSILQEPRVTKLFCVDHWVGCPDGDQFGDRLGAQGFTPEHVFQTFCRNMGSDLFRRVFPVTGTSETVAAIWPYPVSMVYLDGDHEKLWRDIELWLPHVCRGGILAGHDYNVFASVNRDVERLSEDREVNFSGHVWNTVI